MYVFENILSLYRLNLIKAFSLWSVEALLATDNIIIKLEDTVLELQVKEPEYQIKCSIVLNPT